MYQCCKCQAYFREKDTKFENVGRETEFFCPKCGARLIEDSDVLSRDAFNPAFRSHKGFPLFMFLLVALITESLFIDLFLHSKHMALLGAQVRIDWVIGGVITLMILACYWWMSRTSDEDISDMVFPTKEVNR